MKKIKQFKRILFLVLSFSFALSASAQDKTITGTVTSESDGLGLPGVNVVVKGTTTGTATDFDGNYSINVSGDSTILVFSYVGYVTQEITVGVRNEISIALIEDAASLDEVVVVGYGARKKSDITGSVSSVKAEEVTAFPVLDAQQALQGRAAGVAVQSNNGGEPGTPINVTIRGNTSINASSAALVVVDGFVGATYPQPGDIESVEVLKDASATAIYGSRGANGVILVTTKKGRKGKMTVELNSNYAIQSTSNRLDLLNADQFATYTRAINPSYTQAAANTDWQDLIYTSGYTTNHQLSFSGGSDNMNYYVSGNYFDQKGVVINSGFERFSFLSNIDAQINDKLKLGFNAFGSRSSKDGVSTQANSGGRGSGDVISIAYRFAPDLGILDENGNNTFNSVGDDIDNPFAVATERVDETVEDAYRANFYGEYQIIEGLTFKSTFGFSSRNQTRGQFTPSTLITSAGDQGGIAGIANLKNTNLLSENYLTYTKEIGKGNLTLLAGYSYQKDRTVTNSAGAEGFVTNSVSYYALNTASTPLFPNSFLREFEIQSQYGRVNYDYDDKYLITFTARRDGASNFAKNNKYAFFPSGALGWKISNEDFLKDNATISNLKLRVSYGVTGNPSIAPLNSLATLQSIYAVTGDQTVNAVVSGRPANPNLKWESSYQTNFGIDLGLWRNKASLSVDIYNIDTKDLIVGNSSTPEYTGFLNPNFLDNIGQINNKGVEITLSTRNIVTDNFSWSTDLNWSRNRNTVEKLFGNDVDFFLPSAAPGHFLQDETHILREGEALGQFFGYEYRGVYQGGTLPEGTATFSGAVAGDELFTDVDGSGEINSSDRKIIGDPNQDWTFGFNNTLKYKNFDLGIFFQGAVGGDIYSFTLSELASGGSNATTEAVNAWTPSNTDTNVPSPASREKRMNSRFVFDGTYVRLKNLVFGYNLPQNITEKLGMDNVRFSISGQNLLTITDYPGTDPEVSYRASGSQNANVNQGFDYGNYPNIESVTFSLNLKF
ncbi:SusC/RagA family TonB-linked outer membrane protein [Seonamhaeicola aphaedonensis]|uniref:TonB-linked SusC/RagA family outer membrane protein n=1 Tax=Seonamhaeicola aphaedonensis TaxID=1461338 RepID=A0A3D9H986_9FLAO|nr:TonB-dependent receptor [Seonamhaeicola aphaedonensis]RED45731.1 TonB-linked SusC/RagA family outer membrane protein [Seonamhaeicola aphaedonensis]